jgi:hypothetical protein
MSQGGTWTREQKRTVKQKETADMKSKKKKPSKLNEEEHDGLLQLLFNKKSEE